MKTSLSVLDAQQEFERLFQRSRMRAYRIAYRLTGNAADAEDALQDAYLRAWSHFDQYDPTCSFEGWLFRILTNRILDLRRRKQRWQMLPLEALTAEQDRKPNFRLLDTCHESPQSVVLYRSLKETLEQAIDALPESHRAMLRLCTEEHQSYQEIADTMNCALGTVRSRLHRSRKSLQRLLQ